MKTISRLRRRDGERLSALQQIKRSRESYLLLAPFMLDVYKRQDVVEQSRKEAGADA